MRRRRICAGVDFINFTIFYKNQFMDDGAIIITTATERSRFAGFISKHKQHLEES
jgi:hypothetical protein